MSDENSIAKSGDLSKPASILIEKISDAVGGIFKPYQIVRVAKAEAKAELIRTDAQIQVTDLQRRAVHRLVEEESKRQLNMESITELALPLLKETSSPQNVADDWLTNCFDKCRIISDGDMQQWWSRVLAGEANGPGTFSKRTVNLLADLDRSDAELFVRLCGLGWRIDVDDLIPLIFNLQSDIYNRQGINFSSLSHLETLGFIQFTGINHHSFVKLPRKIVVSYHGRTAELTLPKEADNRFELGYVLFTQAGQQLAPVCDAKPVEGFFEYVYDSWVSQGLVAKPETDPVVPSGPSTESH